MNRILLFICLCLCLGVRAGSIHTTAITRVSDSILASKVGDHLMPYFQISADGSHYNYLSNGKRLIAEPFLSKKKITKAVFDIWVLYQFNYTKINGMKAGFWIKLDGNLKLKEEPILNCVPQFLIDDKPSTFLPQKQVLDSARKLFYNKGGTVSDAKLEYQKKTESYVYVIFNKNVQLQGDKKVIELEVIEMHAETGQVVDRYTSYNGLIEK